MASKQEVDIVRETLLDISQALKPKPVQPFRVAIRGFESSMCFRQACATRVVLPSKAIRDSRTISRNAACTSKLRKKEIHLISDAIAKLMANGPHTI